MFSRDPLRFTGHAPSAWPVLLVLLAAAIVPSLCVLWFMHAAMANEQLAMRQRVTDIYRQHLTLVRQQLDREWRAKAEALTDAEKEPAQRAFFDVIQKQTADAAIVLGDAGGVAYPSLDDHTNSTAAAGANTTAELVLQRARVQAADGDVKSAVGTLTSLTGPEFKGARDSSGRLIAPNALLYAINLAPADGRLLKDLKALVMDYSGPAMPSSQRMMLLSEIARRTGEHSRLLDAEQLAAACVESKLPPADTHLMRGAGGVWTLASANRRVIGIYRDATIASMLASVPIATPAGARVILQAPSDQAKAPEPMLAVDVGSILPDFRLALYSQDDALPAAVSRKSALYLWTGAAGILLIAIMTTIVGKYVAAQVRLTHLKNDLIATVSHELKTPLASMRLLLDTLLDHRCTNAQQAEDYLRLIARENHRLSRLIDNFLTFSRMERNKRAFDVQTLDLREIVLAAKEAVEERFVRPNERLEIEVPEDLPNVRGDRDALVTVLVNLLENAHKYTQEKKLVQVMVRPEANEVCIEVRDNGIGIPRRALKRIFDRFYQVDQNLSRRAGGCGLGLSIVQFIVEAHGGRIDVASSPGEGSSFVIRLPAMELSAQKIAAHA